MSNGIDLVRDLVTTAQVIDAPHTVSGKGRPPMYHPMIEMVLDKAPQAVVFGPFTGDTKRADCERVRTGCHSYVTDHPELLPEGKTMRFSVRAQADGSYALTAWLDERTEA